MKRGLILVGVAVLAISIGHAFAATLTVGSDHLWASATPQTLTKGTCTLTGTTQSTDTYVNQGSSSSSYGGTTTMLVQPNRGSEKQSLILFDLSKCPTAIPTTGGADSATLSLRITSAPKSSRTLTVWRAGASWSSSTTWNTRPSTGSQTTTFSTGTNASTVSIPVTIDVDNFIQGTSNDGWVITDEGSSAAQDTTTFATSNAASNKPTLTITYEQ